MCLQCMNFCFMLKFKVLVDRIFISKIGLVIVDIFLLRNLCLVFFCIMVMFVLKYCFVLFGVDMVRLLLNILYLVRFSSWVSKCLIWMINFLWALVLYFINEMMCLLLYCIGYLFFVIVLRKVFQFVFICNFWLYWVCFFSVVGIEVDSNVGMVIVENQILIQVKKQCFVIF